MIIFKTLFSEALLDFPYNDCSIFTIVKEPKGDNNRYHSLEWNTDYFFDLLLNQTPRAVNLLFIPPNYWLEPNVQKEERKKGEIHIWEKIRHHRGAFVTKEYAKNQNDTINMFIDRCIRHKHTSPNSTMFDLAKILFLQEILVSTINMRSVMYPLDLVQKEIKSCKNKNEMISKIIGRQLIVDKVVDSNTIDLNRYVDGFTKGQISKLRKEVNKL